MLIIKLLNLETDREALSCLLIKHVWGSMRNLNFEFRSSMSAWTYAYTFCVYLWYWDFQTFALLKSYQSLKVFSSFFLDTHKPKTLLPLPRQVENIHVKPKEKITLPTWRHFSEHGGLFLWVFVAWENKRELSLLLPPRG